MSGMRQIGLLNSGQMDWKFDLGKTNDSCWSQWSTNPLLKYNLHKSQDASSKI